MVTDRQVARLLELTANGMSLATAALKTGMCEGTARKYRKMNKLPSESQVTHDWRTRPDPFDGVWESVEEQLELNAGIQAKTVFEWLQRVHPGRFQDGQLRTLQRRIKAWRALEGPAKEVFFAQTHHPGDLCASDFTHIGELLITIQGQPLDALLYHFALTYSNWESATLCYSESFEALCDGFQRAVWSLGGVPKRHRTDRFSAAVNNLDEQREFTDRYKGLMRHYDIEMEKTQARHPNENGDIESSHGKLKTAIDQALMLRDSRDFESKPAFTTFLEELISQRNRGREKRLQEELPLLTRLPSSKLESFSRIQQKVSTGSLIKVKKNTYSVHSRLVGESIDIRVFADHLEIWYAQRKIDKLPRLRGQGKHHINYRHIIDWLVRKPGAFENYRYREDLFPSIHFRQAYDELCQQRSKNAATKDYLRILELAAKESESRVEDALRTILSRDSIFTLVDVEELVFADIDLETPANVTIDDVDLNTFDFLLQSFHTCMAKESSNGIYQYEATTDRSIEGAEAT